MKSLYEYILESATKFDHFTNDLDTLKTCCPSLAFIKYPDIEEKMKKLFSQLDEEMMFIYAQGASIFKIQRGYNEELISLLSEFGDDVKYSDNKGSISVQFSTPAGKKGKYKYITVFKTGDGSIGRVSTEQQESATCMIWNAFVNGEIDVNNTDLNARDAAVKNFVSSISESFDKDWIRTFSKHVIAICDYFNFVNNRDGVNLNPFDYNLCLSHKPKNQEADPERVGETYGDFVWEYAKACGAKAKDPFDPSDVIAYRRDDASNITSSLKSYISDPIAGKAAYKKELFDTYKVIGFSLKKITGVKKNARFDTYNDGKSADKCKSITSFEVDKRTSNKQVVISCVGDFNFDGTTTEEGKVVGREKVINVILRSFGAVAMDCTVKNDGPTLGKCPVTVWRRILGTKPGSPLNVCVKAFKDYLEKNDEETILNDLKTIILASIKQGEHCFPFVLIH